MAMQPVFEHAVHRSDVYFPPLTGNAYRDGVAFDDDKIGVGKCCLQKARHQKVSRSFFYADPLALVPVGMPARVQSGNVLRRHQRGVFRPMRAWIKAKSASTAKIGRDRVNIL